jgi:hypothetical protein
VKLPSCRAESWLAPPADCDDDRTERPENADWSLLAPPRPDQSDRLKLCERLESLPVDPNDLLASLPELRKLCELWPEFEDHDGPDRLLEPADQLLEPLDELRELPEKLRELPEWL